MKRHEISLIAIVFLIITRNFNPLNAIFSFFVEGRWVEGILTYAYVTGNKKYVFTGDMEDSLSDPYYKRYRLMYYNLNPTLYRRQLKKLWKFWRWREYLTQDYWRQPYLEVSDNELGIIFDDFGKKYYPYHGPIPPRSQKDSTSAFRHARIPNWIDSLVINSNKHKKY